MIDEKKLIEESTWYPTPLSAYEAGWNDCNRDWMKRIEEQPQVGGWTPVSERMPECEGMYLITSKVFDKAEVHYVFYQKNIEMFVCNGTAIAWMPLPEPYKAGEQDD